MIVQEALSPFDRHRRVVARLLRQHDRFTASEVRALYRELQRVRRLIVAELAQYGTDRTEYQPWQLASLRDAIDDATRELARGIGTIQGGALRQSWEQGTLLVPEALTTVGIRMPSRAVGLLPLNLIQQIGADLVVQVSADFRNRARGILSRGVLGQRSPFAVMGEIANLLRTEPTRQQPRLGTIATQAERIMRTEMMSAFNIGNQIRTQQIGQDLPDLRKYWLSAEDARVRPAHAAADERYRPGGTIGPIPQTEDYEVGGERCFGPHDPRLSAGNRINCRCVSLVWNDDWFGRSPRGRGD